jgi:hypothetical protein
MTKDAAQRRSWTFYEAINISHFDETVSQLKEFYKIILFLCIPMFSKIWGKSGDIHDTKSQGETPGKQITYSAYEEFVEFQNFLFSDEITSFLDSSV